jgi:hypothetical protein
VADAHERVAPVEGGLQRVGLLLLDLDPAEPLLDLGVLPFLFVFGDRDDGARDLLGVGEGVETETDPVAYGPVVVSRVARGDRVLDDVDDAVVVLDHVDEAQELVDRATQAHDLRHLGDGRRLLAPPAPATRAPVGRRDLADLDAGLLRVALEDLPEVLDLFRLGEERDLPVRDLAVGDDAVLALRNERDLGLRRLDLLLEVRNRRALLLDRLHVAPDQESQAAGQ